MENKNVYIITHSSDFANEQNIHIIVAAKKIRHCRNNAFIKRQNQATDLVFLSGVMLSSHSPTAARSEDAAMIPE